MSFLWIVGIVILALALSGLRIAQGYADGGKPGGGRRE